MCGQALADKFKLDYIETSAKSGANVELIFNLMAESLDLAHKNNAKTAAQKAKDEADDLATSQKPNRAPRQSRRSRDGTIRLSYRESSASRPVQSTETPTHTPSVRRWQCCTF